jgi:hypothetical protein
MSNLVDFQKDFAGNLASQLSNITNLQNVQVKLFSDLERLAGSPNINSQDVQDQIRDKFTQIENLTGLRSNIFETIKSNYGLTQSDYNIQRKSYAQQLVALEIIENDLTNTSSKLRESILIRDNSERMVGINNYYTRRYEAHADIMKNIIFYCGIIILVIFLMRMGFISDEITSLLIIVALAIGVIIVGKKVLDLMRRNNIDYDKYNFPFNPKDVKDDTNRRVLSEATTRTLAQDSLLNVCKDIDKKKCLTYEEPFVPFQLKNRNYKISNPDDGSFPIPSSDTVYNCSAEYSEL